MGKKKSTTTTNKATTMTTTGESGESNKQQQQKENHANKNAVVGASKNVVVQKKAADVLLLMQELQENNDFFDFCVDIIPSKLYIHNATGDDYNPRFFKKAAKVETKEARRAAAKLAKRQKLDPDMAETTVAKKRRLQQQQQQQEQQEEFLAETTNLNKGSGGGGAGAGKGPSAAAASATGAAAATAAAAATTTLTVSAAAEAAEAAVSTGATTAGSSRIEALRARLHAKIAEKQGNRPNGTAAGTDAAAEPGAISKRAARRAEKEKRQEEAARRKNNKKSSSTSSSATTTANKSYTVGDASASPSNATQDLAQLDFGRLTGLNTLSADKKKKGSAYTQSNKALQNLGKPKNLKKMLEDAQAKQKRLQELSQAAAAAVAKGAAVIDSDAAKAAVEKRQKLQWTDAFSEADGTRIKDNPQKLKRAIQKKQAQKKKSQKAWKTRLEQTATAAKNRQAIRSHNLKARQVGGQAGANLSRKEIKTNATTTSSTTAGAVAGAGDKKKKKRIRPGFEGKKGGGYLNTSDAKKKNHQ